MFEKKDDKDDKDAKQKADAARKAKDVKDAHKGVTLDIQSRTVLGDKSVYDGNILSDGVIDGTVHIEAKTLAFEPSQVYVIAGAGLVDRTPEAETKPAGPKGEVNPL